MCTVLFLSVFRLFQPFLLSFRSRPYAQLYCLYVLDSFVHFAYSFFFFLIFSYEKMDLQIEIEMLCSQRGLFRRGETHRSNKIIRPSMLEFRFIVRI